MKPKKLILFLLFAALAVLLSACSGSAFLPSGWTGITVEENVAYLAHNQYVYAVDVNSGTQLWQFPERGQSGRTFYTPPVLSHDGTQLLVGSYNNNLYALSSQTPQEEWVFETQGRIIGAPLVTSRGIYAPSSDNVLYAVDANRSPLWTYRAEGSLWAQPAASSDESVIYVTSLDHHIYALDAETGRLRWNQNLGGAVVGTPTLSEDGSRIYIGSFSQNMYALDAQNGQVIWTTPTQGWVWAGPALFEDRLYFGDVSGNIYSLDAAAGSIVWQQQPDGPVASTPLVNENGIFIGNEAGTVVAFDHSGAVQWTQGVGGPVFTTPVQAGDVLLVAPMNTDHRLVALNPNGTQRWIYTPAR
jgi:eukaryotic-like serine/threonine-protein kinase